MYLWVVSIAASWMLEPFVEVGANFSLQLSLRTQFAKIKKVIAKNQCEKHKKSNLMFMKEFFETVNFEKSQQMITKV